MKTILALSKQYLGIVWVQVIGTVLVLSIVPRAFAELTGIATAAESLDASRSFFAPYCGVAFFMLNAIAWTPLAKLLPQSRRLPVKSSTLAVFYLAAPTLLVVLMNVLILTAYRFQGQPSWPVVTTSLSFAMVACVGCASLLWLRSARFYGLPVVLVLWCGCLWWVIRHYFPNGFRQAYVPWTAPSVVDLVVMPTAVLASVFVTIRAYCDFRSGATIHRWLRFLTMADTGNLSLQFGSGRTAQTQIHMMSPEQAFVSATWRRGWFMTVAVNGLFGILFAVITFSGIHGGRDRLMGIMVMLPTFAGMLGFATSLIHQTHGWLKQDGRMTTLLATMPVSDARLARMLMRSWLRILGCCLIALFAGSVVAILVHGLWLGFPDYSAEYRSLVMVQTMGEWSGLLIPGLACLATWTAGALAATAMSIGRPRATACLLGSAPMIGIFFVGFGHYGGPTGEFIAKLIGYGSTLGVVGLGSICLFIHSWRRNLMTASQLWLSLAIVLPIWLLIGVALPAGIPAKLVCMSLTLLTIVPFAAMPVAVGINRHR
ncbi:MAG: hypothetical protein KDA81_12825 [Planctomycetaceae bacterium]|nr:hypothetical protein [Planctomycetaceae bacterium]